jgi:hypothetical protein
VGHGTYYKVVSKLLDVFVVLLVRLVLLQGYLNETMVVINDLYRYSQRTNGNSKDPNALKHKPMTYSSFLEKNLDTSLIFF